jgi:hypothetical protein
VALGACLAGQAARLQERMVGVPAPALRRCLGEPASFERRDGREFWVYQASYPVPEQDVTIQIVQGPAAAAVPPRVTTGEVAREALGSTQSRTRSTSEIPPGVCLLVFELERGAVRRFVPLGRSRSGVSAAAECTLLVRPCAPSGPRSP